MEDLLKHFPSLKSYTYLDTPANGIVPRPVIAWRREHDQLLMDDPVGFRKSNTALLESVRKRISKHFNAGEAEVGLIPNFSFGINTLLDGLPKNTKILLLKNDYPSVNWPIESRKFEVVYAEIDKNLEENVADAVIKHKPNVFIFSLVQWLNGIEIDLNFLKQLKLNFPNLILVADGTQYLGSKKFDFNKSGIDVIATSAYKWLLGGYGCGFIMLRKEGEEKFSLKTIGFNSAANFGSLREETKIIKHFEPGHLDTLNFGSLEKSLEFIESYGREEVYSKIAHLGYQAKNRFTELSLLEESVALRTEHSSIFNLKGDVGLFKKLRTQNIYCSLRGNGIRVGFHFYNTEEDLEKLIEVLRS